MPVINKHMRETMVKNALTHSFRADIGRLVADRAAFMSLAYDALWDETTRKRVAAVPSGWIEEKQDLQFKSMAETFDVAFSGWTGQWASETWEKYVDKPTAVLRRLPRGQATRSWAVEFPPDSRLHGVWEEVNNRSIDINTRIETAKAATNAAIGQCRTIKQLLKAWPEFAPFANPYDTPDERRLPVVQTERLNAMLDLPVGDELNVMLNIGVAA